VVVRPAVGEGKGVGRDHAVLAAMELGPAVHGGLGRAMRKRAPESEEGV
jgi:hypothetical protein